MKTTNILTAVLLICGTVGASAQHSGSLAVGARVSPDGGGFTAKFFPDRNIALELQVNGSGGYFNTSGDGASVAAVGLLEYNIIFTDPSWRLFIGPGMHVGTWDRTSGDYYDRHGNSQPVFGMDGIFGVEYILKRTPLGFSADVKPAVNLASDVAFFPNNFFGVSARYYFSHKMLQPRRPPVSKG